MVHLLLAVIYLSFISLGLPDGLLGAAWPSIYPEIQVPVSYAGTVAMIICLGTIISSLLSDRLTHKLGSAGLTGFFLQQFILDALPLGHSLRIGRRKCGRYPEQLCGPSLFQPPYELAALHVGRGCFGRTVSDGLSAVRRAALVPGIFVYRHRTNRSVRNIAAEPATVEANRSGVWF